MLSNLSRNAARLVDRPVRTARRNLWKKTGHGDNDAADNVFKLDPAKIVMPGAVSPQLELSRIPAGVTPPPYAFTAGGVPDRADAPSEPEVKDAECVGRMRRACALARRVLTAAGEMTREAGATTDDIDRLVTEMCFAAGAYPSPLSYKGFPKSVCTSVNNVACHGIPDDRKLQDGDIINIDVTVYLDGVHGDCSETYAVGELRPEDKAEDAAALRLMDATRDCLDGAVDLCKPGAEFSRLGEFIEDRARQHGFNVVGAFTGHGIGSYFHGPPDVYHVRNAFGGGEMRPGMTFTVEPILCEGSGQIGILEDGWTAVTLDLGRSAQFEHTVLVTEEEGGCEVLTRGEEAAKAEA